MAEKYEVHNQSSSQGGNHAQIGVNKGTVWFGGSSSAENTREARLRDLAAEVRSAGDRELEKWGIRDRDSLPVRWHAAAEDLFDYWEKIQADGTPVSLAGQFTSIRKTYEAIESRRLVILGRAGAGKTVLAHRLILDLLTSSPTGPVPVLFSLGDWNPATELRRWLAEHLARDFLFLDAQDPTTKTKLAEVFVERGLILPVLDGFDEIPEGDHRRAAIRQISTLDMPLIVTSRLDEYAHAAHEIKAVGGAAAISLEDLTLDEAREYLRQSTGKSRGPAWDAVFKELGAEPDKPASQNLTTVLTSPLMVTLTRTVYNDDQGHHPGELLDAKRFSEVEDLECHLLAAYLDTVYARRDTGPRRARRPNWTSDQARRWLGYLATHLRNRKTHDLSWWQLPATLSRRTRFPVTAAIVGLTFVLAYGLTYGFTEAFTYWLTEGSMYGYAAGLTAGLANEVRFSRGRTREPERLRLRLRRRSSQPHAGWMTYLKTSTSALTVGLTVGLIVGLTIGLTELVTVVMDRPTNFTQAVTNVLTDTEPLTGGLALGLALGLPSVIVAALGDTSDPHTTGPWTLLTRDRTVTLIGAATTAVLAAMLAEPIGLTVTFALGLFCAPIRLALSAWGNWLLFARLWLPLTGRLPWRPKRFLEDAYARGVLRTTGAVYQFRHARLRDHLANHYRTQPNRTAPEPD